MGRTGGIDQICNFPAVPKCTITVTFQSSILLYLQHTVPAE